MQDEPNTPTATTSDEESPVGDHLMSLAAIQWLEVYFGRKGLLDQISSEWSISRKLHNRLMHALNGNTESIITRVHLEGAPMLTAASMELNSFLLWTIDLKAYCITTGLTEWIIGPTPADPDDADALEKHNRKKSLGLRYLCAMIGNADLRSAVALNAGTSGNAGYTYLTKEFLQGQSVQSKYLTMLQSSKLERDGSVVVFRNQWQKIASQLDPRPCDNILCEFFAHSVSADTSGFYDGCLDQDIDRGSYEDYTRKLTQLCQARKDRYDNKAKDESRGRATGHKTTKEAIAYEVRQALEAAGVNPKSGKDKDRQANLSNRRDGRKEERECVRCGKKHPGGRDACRAPKVSCPFAFPDGTKCGGDHHIKFCWAKNPSLCRLPKVRQAIERRLGKKGPSANRATAESESEDDEATSNHTKTLWGDYSSDSDTEDDESSDRGHAAVQANMTRAACLANRSTTIQRASYTCQPSKRQASRTYYTWILERATTLSLIKAASCSQTLTLPTSRSASKLATIYQK